MNIATKLLPASESLQLDSIKIGAERIEIKLTSIQTTTLCPMCKMAGSRVHSHYMRKFVDAPWAGIAVHIQLCVRRFFCDNPVCGRTTFTEQIAELIAPFAQRTIRLAVTQRSLGLALGGEAGARLAKDLSMKTSPDTLLRLIRNVPQHTTPIPRILGIDDWAFKKGRTYGTVLVDLEQRRIVDLLSDRTTETVAAWFKQHPGVEIVTRDRAGAYAEAVTQGAPDVIQVADRFHLLLNLREALERFFDRHQADLRKVKMMKEPSPEKAESKPKAREITPSTITPATIHLSMESESRRQVRFADVQQLKAQGATRNAIAQQLRMSVNTVARYLRADELLIRTPRAPISTVERFAPFLQQRWQGGCHSPLELWKEIQQQGYAGSQSAVWRWVNRYRATMQLLHPEDQTTVSTLANPKVDGFVLSSRQAAWVMLHRTEELKTEEKKWLEQFETVCELVVKVRDLAQQFTHMVTEKASTLLNDWIVSAKNSGVTDLRNFALGLQRDWDAVSNALKLSWSNGPTEGHVNRLKVIKRQMYGRASFDLLRCRVLPAG